MNKILCSAVYVDDGEKYEHQPINIKTGFVVCGRRHHNCFMSLQLIFKDLKSMIPYKKEGKVIQGFLTTDNRFLNRKESLKVAKSANQVTGTISKVLTSEDLW